MRKLVCGVPSGIDTNMSVHSQRLEVSDIKTEVHVFLHT